MSEKVELPEPGDDEETRLKRKEKRTREERYMVNRVKDITALPPDSVVTFYNASKTVRYFMRLTMPIYKRGMLVYYPYRKGRPSYSFMHSYKLPPHVREFALVAKRNLPDKVTELLFKTVPNKEIEQERAQINKEVELQNKERQ